jgi:hypothetical protein
MTFTIYILYRVWEKPDIWEATTVHTSFDVQVFIIEVHTYSIVKKNKWYLIIYESCRRSMYLKTYVNRTYVFILIHNKRQFEIDDLSISELILKLAAQLFEMISI